MKNNLTKFELFSDSDLKYQLYSGNSEIIEYADILVIKFIGQYRIGSAGNPDAAFMQAVSRTAIFEIDPDGILLDLRELHYEWGDMLDGVFELGERYYPVKRETQDEELLFESVPIPQATLIGPYCKEAIYTLIADVGDSAEECEWLFEDFDMAWNYLEWEITRQRQDVD
jgi:hypothetical protein